MRETSLRHCRTCSSLYSWRLVWPLPSQRADSGGAGGQARELPHQVIGDLEPRVGIFLVIVLFSFRTLMENNDH